MKTFGETYIDSKSSLLLYYRYLKGTPSPDCEKVFILGSVQFISVQLSSVQ